MRKADFCCVGVCMAALVALLSDLTLAADGPAVISDTVYTQPQQLVEVQPNRRLNPMHGYRKSNYRF
jgi:hypothetical protein